MDSPLIDHANRVMAVGSGSFAAATKLFAHPVRHSALMLYAWCRHCDDAIDNQTLGLPVTTPCRYDAIQRLEQLQLQTRRAFDGETMSEPAFAALQAVALRHAIPAQLAFEHLEGFAMDVHETRYVTFEDTLRYCYHVAGVVGLMMAQIMGVNDETTLDRACDLGLAFQLTNIARDIVDDVRTGRCYLPADWLRQEGIDASQLVCLQHRDKLARLARRLVAEAEPYYKSAQAGLNGLSWRSAWATAAAHGVYREIGLKVSAAGEAAWERRTSTSRREKLWLTGRGLIMALSSRTGNAPPRDPALWQRPSVNRV